jgi:hypothetical protein
VIVGNVGTLGRGMQAMILGEERARGGSTDPNQRPRRGGATR